RRGGASLCLWPTAGWFVPLLPHLRKHERSSGAPALRRDGQSRKYAVATRLVLLGGARGGDRATALPLALRLLYRLHWPVECERVPLWKQLGLLVPAIHRLRCLPLSDRPRRGAAGDGHVFRAALGPLLWPRDREAGPGHLQRCGRAPGEP